jgi:hypothetical protein
MRGAITAPRSITEGMAGMVRKRQQWLRTAPLFGLSLFLLFCGRDYNPFADLTNAKVRVLSWGPENGVPVALYQTFTVKTVVAVREAVDSFRVTAKENRFWTDTVIRLKSSREEPADAQTYLFALSFHDTGIVSVSVVTYRSNGEVIPQERRYRIVNPLHQNNCYGQLGMPLSLATPPVYDKDVRYLWNFDGDRMKISPVCSTKVTLHDSIFSGTGALIVTDLYGKDSTPPVYFAFSLRDTIPPLIVCNGAVHDTIVTADTIFAFRAWIDDSGSGVGHCTVNGDPFNLVNQNTRYYTKLYTGMQRFTPANGALAITVRAPDRAGNVAQHTCYALFDPAGQHDQCQLTIVSPSSETMRAWTRDAWVYGNAVNSSTGPLTIRCKFNGAFSPIEWQVESRGGKDFQWHLLLDTARTVDSIEIGAYTATGERIASVRREIIYDPAAPDLKNPMIWSIGAGSGRWNDQRLFVNADSVTLAITAFDDGSGVDSLLVNNALCRPDSESGYLWHVAIAAIPHTAKGLPVTIRVIDRSRNEKDSTITLIRNTPPVFNAPPNLPATLCVDSIYTFPLYDADGDAVAFFTNTDSTLKVAISAGVLSLQLKASSVGKTDTISLQLSDGYEKSAPAPLTFSCVNCSAPVTPVRFLTGAADFPALLQAGRDTLRVKLTLDVSPPPAGLRYSSWLAAGAGGIPLLDQDTSSLIQWAPTPADTGLRRITARVGNGSATFDSLSVSIAVVPRNQYPCSLSCRFTGTTGTGGELLLKSLTKPETLFVSILDKDDPRVEQYTVGVIRHNVSAVQTLDKKTFFVAIQPDSARALDTLLLRVRDLTGTADSARFFIRYAVSNPGAWQYQRTIGLSTTAAGAGVAAAVYQFPVLLRLTKANFNFSQARRYGEDLRFEKTDNTPIPYEIERYDSVNGLADIWVKIDTVYGNDNTHSFVMRWGNPAAVDAQNSRAVFDTTNGFVAVWHLKEGGTGIRYNSVQYNFNATPGANFRSSGKPALIAFGDSLSGNDYFTAGRIEVNTAISLSAWVKPVNYTQYGSIVAKEWSPNHVDPFQAYGLVMDNKTPSHCQFTLGINGTQQVAVSTSVITLNQWTYLNGTWDGQTETVFFNGASQTRLTAVGTSGTIPPTPQTETTIGQNSSVPTERFNGVLDEIRIEKVSRSAEWIKLCYMNQRTPDALVVFR